MSESFVVTRNSENHTICLMFFVQTFENEYVHVVRFSAVVKASRQPIRLFAPKQCETILRRFYAFLICSEIEEHSPVHQ